MLGMRDVHKRYGSVRALSGVDFDVSRENIVALLGQNGAGKTTLVSIVAGLCRPDRGSVWVGGIDVTARPQLARRQLGFVPQETGIYPTVSVRDNLHFFGELAGLRRQRLQRRITEIAETFALTGLLNRKGHSLSGGEARRLHTAMTVMHSPRLLLLDEPTVGMDIPARNQLLRLITSLAEEGTAVVYSTHYLHEVEQLDASRAAILVQGQIAAAGSIPHLVSTLGGASVELRFNAAPPALDWPHDTIRVGSDAIRVPTEGSPAVAAARLLERLDGVGGELPQIKLLQPNLESAFLAITCASPFESASP